jgi:ADP-ribosylglycohydrolase
MALCLAESLLECKGFDPIDQLARYVRWMREGHHSSNGECFDVGTTVRLALGRFERTGQPSGSTEERSAGNGSLMRLAPVPLFFAADAAVAVAKAAESSRTTHAHPEAVDACRYFAGLLLGALVGASKEQLLQPAFSPSPDVWRSEPLSPAIATVAEGSFLRSEPPAIRGGGYVTHSLEAALWAFAKSTCFEDGALLAVNLGDDADTIGAIYGQLAGAFYGVDSIPERWRKKLAKLDVLESFASRVFEAAEARR